MARILVGALAVAAGITVGFLTSNPMLGFSVFSIVESIGSALLPHSLPAQQPLNDLNVMSSAPGVPIPYGFGTYRVAGEVIAAQTIQFHKHQQSTGGKGGKGAQTIYTYDLTAAIAFGYGPGQITRVWADSKLVYDATGKGPIAISTGLSNSNGVALTSPFTPIFYTGSTTQLPDPNLQALFGVDLTPAYRGMIYMVIVHFPLADFGNRCPNFRAEVVNSNQLSYLDWQYPNRTIAEPDNPAFTGNYHVVVDKYGRSAYGIGPEIQSVIRYDLDVTVGAPADPYANNTLYHLNDQVLDSNNNIQLCIRQHTSQSSGHPAWQTGQGAITQVSSQNTWANLGPGPDQIPVTNEGLFSRPGYSAAGGSSSITSFTICDTAGRIWTCTSYPTDNLGHTAFFADRYDPRSFARTAHVPIPSVPNLVPSYLYNYLDYPCAQKLKSGGTGRDYLYCLTAQYQGLVVIDCDAASNVANGTWSPSGPNTATYSRADNTTPVAVDPNTGVCYLAALTVSGGISTAHIITLDPRNGGTTFVINDVTVTGSWKTQAGQVISSCVFDQDDNTLICFTTNSTNGHSTMLKVDPKTGTVLATLLDIGYGSGNISAQWSRAYCGIIPSDGVLKITDINNTSWVYVRASDLSVLQTIPKTNWWNGFGALANETEYGFDDLSNSMMALIVGQTFTTRYFFDRKATGSETLDVVLSTLWAKTGADPTLLDTSKVTSIGVDGYGIISMQAMKSIVEPLTNAYFFEMVESDNLMRAIPRGQSITTVIPEADLGTVEDNFEAQPTILQEYDLPLTMYVNYYDPALDYQQAKQQFKRNKKVKKTRNESVLSLPLTLTAAEAAAISARALSLIWAERNQWEFKLWKAGYLVIDPTDAVQFTYNGKPYQARIQKMSMGQNSVLSINAVSEDPRQYTAVGNGGDGATGFTESSVLPVGQTLLFVLDTPYISDGDSGATGLTGYYWLVSTPNIASAWDGAQLYQSPDGNSYNLIGADTVEATYGTIVDTVGSNGSFTGTPPPENLFSWDYDNTITVRLTQGTLASDTDINVLGGSNLFYFGGELGAFGVATLNTDGTYTLSRLLRGLRGTEPKVRFHQPAETFILLNGSSVQHEATPTSFINQLQYFKGVTFGLPVTGAAPQQATLVGNDLKPYAPAQFQGALSAGTDLAMTWQRRTRLGGAWLDSFGTVPVSETSEAYNLDIMYLNFGGVRPIHYTYSAAPQNVAGIPGTATPSVYFDQTASLYRVRIPAFTLTWEDGVSASYLGPTSANPPNTITTSGPNEVSGVNGLCLWVHDPNRTGDATGLAVTYGYNDTLPDNWSPNNTSVLAGSGYWMIGVIPPFKAGLDPSLIETFYVAPLSSCGDGSVRTFFGLPTPTATYTSAQMVADFGRNEMTAVGSPGFVRARVFQMSQQVGRGFATDNPQVGIGTGVVSGGSDATSILGVNIRNVTLVDGSILQYNASNNTWDIIGPMLKRQTITKTTGSLLAGGSESGTLTVNCRSFVLISVESSDLARVQLYETSAFRTADNTRTEYSIAAAGGENGIIVDESFITGGDETRVMSSPLLASNMDSPTAQQVYYTITNNTGGTTPITAKFVIIPIEY